MGVSKRSATKAAAQIIFDSGDTFVTSDRMSAYFKYKKWLFQINPRLLPPGLRKDHRKKIYVNGRKYGYAEYRHGCIPMYPYLDDRRGLDIWLLNWIRVHLGLCCRRSDRDYFYIKLRHQEYVVLRRYTNERNTVCKIYVKTTGEMLGTFIFDSDFSNVYPHWSVENWVYSMYVIMGYVADAVIYSVVAQQLNRKINIIVG